MTSLRQSYNALFLPNRRSQRATRHCVKYTYKLRESNRKTAQPLVAVGHGCFHNVTDAQGLQCRVYSGLHG